MYKDRTQLLKEIEKLQEERHSLRLKEAQIYRILAIVIGVVTAGLIFNSFIGVTTNQIYVSIFLNIVSCFYIIRELVKKNTKVSINDSSPINVFEKGEKLYTLSEGRLNELLSICVEKENYEIASKVRDELKKFKNN